MMAQYEQMINGEDNYILPSIMASNIVDGL